VDTNAAAPLKLVLTLRAHHGERAALDAWIRELLATATETGSLQGSSVLSDADRSFVLLRFATPAERDLWRTTPEVEALMARGAGFVAATEPIERTGLETWFALPGSPAADAAPPKWKMAIVTWCALLPQVVVLALVVPKSLPLLVSVAISTAIPVSMLTWVLMPWLTKLLARWLYRPDPVR
jgi:antibiotic biosynthesis monooxygenase (ABM) superfamily enzyme